MKNDLFLTDSILADSIENSIHTLRVINQLPEQSFLQETNSVANVIIALVNIILLIYFFIRNNRKNDVSNEKSRKINLLKTLVLDYNMGKFYDFFNGACEVTKKLQATGLSVEAKSHINEEVADLITNFRQNFIDLFIAVDMNLYNNILIKTDSFVDGLTDTIFDEGINLSHKPKFEESITKEIRESKTEIIKLLFSYSGE